MSLGLHSDHYRPEDKAGDVKAAPREAADRSPPHPRDEILISRSLQPMPPACTPTPRKALAQT